MIIEDLNDVDLNNDSQNDYSRNLYKIAVDEVSELVECVADRKSIVTAYGESEISRELVARSVHILSPRCNHKFVSINCAAIPKNMIQRELFGYKQEVSGVKAERKGHFELADNGTLFIDEIDDLDDETQEMLLQALQSRSICRVGDTEPRKVNVRLIVGTRHNLSELTRAGKFRDDLYFKLNIFPIHIPSSKRCVDDLQLLVYAITSKIKKQLQFEVAIKPVAFRTILHHMWQGDKNELSELLERVSILYSIGELQLYNVQNDYNLMNDYSDQIKFCADRREIPERVA